MNKDLKVYNQNHELLTDYNIEEGFLSMGEHEKEDGTFEPCYFYIPMSSERAIDNYKGKLRDTDYVVIKIAEGSAAKEDYQDILDNRVRWRERINDLEEEQK